MYKITGINEIEAHVIPQLSSTTGCSLIKFTRALCGMTRVDCLQAFFNPSFLSYFYRMNNTKQIRKIRALIVFFMIATAISGITAFPVETELHWLLQYKNYFPSGVTFWLQKVYDALHDTNTKYTFLLYGYDWLAFAHLVIALAFIGPLRDPKRNIWIIDWALLCCICVLPLAFIAGPIRGIPLYWRLIDCSFGVFGVIPLLICRKWIKELQ